MGQIYRATGINLKTMALGESDRLLTILTREYGLMRVVAPGARKHRSGMAGRSSLFVVNDLQISSGKSLNRISQAESIYTFAGLGQNLAKLTAAQYLAELVLLQALADQPQELLFAQINQQLKSLESSPNSQLLALLNHGIYQLLAIAGFAPELHHCCLTRATLSGDQPQFGFSISAGGLIKLGEFNQTTPKINYHLNSRELDALQTLINPEPILGSFAPTIWLKIEQILRAYAQYHFDRPIASATLIDCCFNL